MKNVEKRKSFEEVKAEELASISKSQEETKLIGLAFSGGGIRSATVNLGVLQGLAKAKLLNKFDYLSTVSGGGYIAAWFSALLHRRIEDRDSTDKKQANEDAMASLESELAQSTNSRHEGNQSSTDKAIDWLRTHSNYLTPKTGLISLDTLSAVFQWFTHTLLNQLLLFSCLTIVLLLFTFIIQLNTYNDSGFYWHYLNFGEYFIKLPLKPSDIYSKIISSKVRISASVLAIIGFTLFICLVRAIRKKPKSCFLRRIKQSQIKCINLILLIEVIAAYLFLITFPVEPVSAQSAEMNYLVGLGLPLTVFLLTLVIILIRPAFRVTAITSEWWYRLGAMKVRYGLIFLLLLAFSLYIPLSVDEYLASSSSKSTFITLGGVLTWFISFGIAKLGQGSSTSNRIITIVTKTAPYLIITLVFMISGYLSFKLYQMAQPEYNISLCVIAIMVIFILYGNKRIAINVYSLHNFYRNRLTRCYLGASNINRSKMVDTFSGFSTGDDIWISKLKAQRPLPIINTALNISNGKELAWQQRQAASFFFTPVMAGFDTNRHRGFFAQTRNYGYPNNGPLLGSLMAVSGAAASPNMGFRTNRIMGFIMTIFNVRLGRWFGNPIKPEKVVEPRPEHNLIYLFKELFTDTNEDSDFLYLSDGGHFENLGIYELVRRRCKVILAIDAEHDANFTFEGLGNAIRKCKVDFNVDIDIDIDHLHPQKSSDYADFKHSKHHLAIGTINYPKTENDKNTTGILLYLKNSLTGDEPTDLINYKIQQPSFPHRTTADQFFDETEFESYRNLGEHMIDKNTVVIKKVLTESINRSINDRYINGLKEKIGKTSEYKQPTKNQKITGSNKE